MARAGANFKAYFLFAALILRQDEGGVDASALITSGDLRGSHSHLSALMRIGGLADCTKGRTLEFRNFLKIRTNFAKIGTDKNPKISVFGIYPFAGLSGVLFPAPGYEGVNVSVLLPAKCTMNIHQISINCR